MAQEVTKKDLDKHDVEPRRRSWHMKLHLFDHHHSKHDQPKKDPSRSRSASPSKATHKRLDFTKDIPTNIPYPPFVNVEGVPNFRDVGGYACPAPPHAPSTATPFSVRKGYVFRCSELSQITAVGTVTLTHDLNVKSLYDLRSEREAADPRGQPQGVVCISTPVFRKADASYLMAVQQLTWSTAPDEPANAGYSQGYVNWYRQILEYGAKHAYKVVFEHIRDQPDDALLYHCTAGKDRTGVLSALILKLCGVDDDTVAWEYSLTVPGMGVWEDVVEQEMVGDSMMPIRSHGGMTREEAKRVCGSRASNMLKFLQIVLEGEFGGAAKYLTGSCGFTDADVEKILENLVVPGEGTVKAVSFPGYEEHVQT